MKVINLDTFCTNYGTRIPTILINRLCDDLSERAILNEHDKQLVKQCRQIATDLEIALTAHSNYLTNKRA